MAVQDTLRNIDSGLLSRILKIGMITFLIIGLCLMYFLVQFKGLGTEAAMDQAQIARSLVAGEGFSTRYIRPLAISQLGDAGKKIPSERFPEINNAPLSPILEAIALLPIKDQLDMAPTDILGKGDRAIAIEGILLLLAGVCVWYLVARALFDQGLALLAAGLMLVTDLLWQYALAGLPQHLLIILFGTLTLCAIKAREAEERENVLQAMLWLASCGLVLGLMSLAHGIAAFLVPGFMLFCLIGFQERIPALLISLITYLLTVLPWLLHNYLACGNPFGISVYAALAGAGITPQAVMRGTNTGLALGLGMPTKFRGGLLDQGAHLWEYLGLNVTAIGFLFALLHPFRNPTAGLWRWILAVMWVGMSLGMTFFGVKETVSGNQLHIIFLPAFIIFGLAFILVLWNRLAINSPPLRIVFLSLLFLLSGTPMLLTLLTGQGARIQWPPYVPPFIAVLEKWFQPRELLCSDMPWAVAWYSNRKCLLLPDTVHALDEISDYNTLGSPVVGLYLTPVSGNQDFLTLMKGPDKDWGPVIMRTVNLNDFLLKSFTPLPVDGECILYADTERWVQKIK